jgi:hypothetical protein
MFTSPNADDRQIQIHMRDGRPAGIICVAPFTPDFE